MVSSILNRAADYRLTGDIWASFEPPDNDALLASVPALARALLHWCGAPRNPRLMRRFCGELSGRRVLLYGAGTLTRALLRQLPANVQVVGVVDRMAADIGAFQGVPVVSPTQAAEMSFDYALLAHNVYEMEMRRALIDAGVSSDRIITAHADPRYRALAAETTATLTERACRRPADAVIVSCCNTAIINDRQMTDWLPPERTVQLFIGRGGDELEADAPYETIDLQESLEALRGALLRMRPRVVYVRSVLYKNYLGALIKHWLPSSVVIQEFYDYSVLWPDNDLVRLFGLDAVSINRLRQAELIAGLTLDMVISKRGGPEWRAAWSRCRAPYRMIFPQVTPPSAMPPPPPAGDLVYAGFLPAPSFLRAFPVGYNFLPLLEEVCRTGGLTADIFNSSHTVDDGEDIFADYLQRYARPPVTYHARLSYPALLERMRGYRYGWLYNDQQTFHGDRRCGICNRWTGYASAGLPVLLDSSWGFMGDLVREYDAGIVFDDPKAAVMIEMLRTADHTALAAGAARLRSRLLTENAAALADLGALIECGLASPA